MSRALVIDGAGSAVLIAEALAQMPQGQIVILHKPEDDPEPMLSLRPVSRHGYRPARIHSSKYSPHIGAKQRAKAAKRAKQ